MSGTRKLSLYRFQVALSAVMLKTRCRCPVTCVLQSLWIGFAPSLWWGGSSMFQLESDIRGLGSPWNIVKCKINTGGFSSFPFTARVSKPAGAIAASELLVMDPSQGVAMGLGLSLFYWLNMWLERWVLKCVDVCDMEGQDSTMYFVVQSL